MSELRRAGIMALVAIPFGGLYAFEMGRPLEAPSLTTTLLAYCFYSVGMLVMLLLARLPVFRVTGGVVWVVARWGGYLFAFSGVWGLVFGLFYSGALNIDSFSSLLIGAGAITGYLLASQIDCAWREKIDKWIGI